MELIIEATGVNGQIKLYNNRLDITRKGFVAFACHGMDGTKSIFINKLTAIQFKEAGIATNGFIQFIFEGSQENKGGLFSATQDENSIMFNKEQQEIFIKIRDFIFEKINEQS